MKRIVTLAVIGVFIGLVVALSVGCGGESVTGPSQDFTGQSSVGTPTAAAVPAPAPSPTPSVGTPTGERPYVEFTPPAGQGKFCNPMAHPLTLTVEYWNANNFQKQVLLETKQFTAQAGTCVELPPTAEAVKVDCGETVLVQVDAATTEHLGHIFVTVVGDTCCVESEETKVEVVTGEWGECKPANGEANQSTVAPECRKARTVTTTTTTTYAQCMKREPKIVVDTRTEYEKCECKVVCVEEWIAQPEVEENTSEWSECVLNKGLVPTCDGTEKQTFERVVYEVNSCTQVKREKSRIEDSRERKCQTTCEVQCEVSKKEITYCVPVLGNPTEELAFLNGLGLGYSFQFSTKYEDVDTPWYSPKDFDAVLLKSGSCGDGGKEYRLYLGVEKGDRLSMSSGKDISHASIFTLECDR